MDDNIKRYIKREFYKGKSLSARLIDSVFLKILAFVVIFIFFWLIRTGFWRSLILAATVVSSFSILKFVYNRSRYRSFSERRIMRAGDECALERMILLDREYTERLVRKIFAEELDAEKSELRKAEGGFLYDEIYCRYFDCHPKVPVGVNELTELVREMRKLHVKKCILMTPSRFDEDARAMAVRRSDNCIFLENDDLLQRLRKNVIYPSEKEIYEYLSAEIAEKRITREKLRSAFFGADKGRSFALCAAVLLIIPLFTGQNIIYPVAAAVCTGFSIYGFLKSRRNS
ncbi:MAG: restriction endonuclease [Christensenellaceae bacterium]|nr:restriction endonuclease [Christensenellaceae bacterium]